MDQDFCKQFKSILGGHPSPCERPLMAGRQHILALCVTALLLTAGCSAADADAAAAAATQAAASPAVPQTSANVASADPDSSVRVSQQTAREKVRQDPLLMQSASITPQQSKRAKCGRVRVDRAH